MFQTARLQTLSNVFIFGPPLIAIAMLWRSPRVEWRMLLSFFGYRPLTGCT